jgi:hypothetical protein
MADILTMSVGGMPDDWEWKSGRWYAEGAMAHWDGVRLVCMQAHVAGEQIQLDKFLVNPDDWLRRALRPPGDYKTETVREGLRRLRAQNP